MLSISIGKIISTESQLLESTLITDSAGLVFTFSVYVKITQAYIVHSLLATQNIAKTQLSMKL